MLEAYISSWISSMGVDHTSWLLIVIVWDLVWRCLAVWKSTKNNHPVWSILFVLFATIGILPIIYLFIFSKKGKRNMGVKPIKRNSKKKSIKKKPKKKK